MEGLNNNAGLIILIVGIILVAILGVVVWLLVELRKRIAVQRLKFIGHFSADVDSRKMVANITVSNRSLNDITITELGIRNGKVNFDYTDLYKKQSRLSKDARVVVGQRDAIRFAISAEDLVKSLIQNEKGKVVLKKVSVYAMDSTGIAYMGKVSDIRKLLAELAKNGVDYLAPAFDSQTESKTPEVNGAAAAASAWRAPASSEVSAASDKTKKS